MFRWYAARTDDYVAPTKPGMSRSNPTDRRRKRTLDDDEIRALWAATESKSTLNSFVRVLLLTAQRRGKVNHMKRADIKDGTWTIPSERREKGTAGALLLPQRALDIIEKQPIIAGNPYVFAASTGDGPFDSSTKGKLALDAVLRQTLPDMPRWTFHDLRRTARSLMSRAGVRPEIAERVLGHAQGELVETYDRYAYFDEKADAVRKVARLIDTIVNPPDATNIVPMTGRKRRSKARAS
jgi:integrase